MKKINWKFVFTSVGIATTLTLIATLPTYIPGDYFWTGVIFIGIIFGLTYLSIAVTNILFIIRKKGE